MGQYTQTGETLPKIEVFKVLFQSHKASSTSHVPCKHVLAYEGIFGAKQLSVRDSGICSCREQPHMCISKFEATDKSCNVVDFFLSPTNTTQQLHLLGSFIADTQILFYESQIKKLVHSHVLLLLLQRIWCKTFTHLHQKCEVADKFCTSAQ